MSKYFNVVSKDIKTGNITVYQISRETFVKMAAAKALQSGESLEHYAGLELVETEYDDDGETIGWGYSRKLTPDEELDAARAVYIEGGCQDRLFEDGVEDEEFLELAESVGFKKQAMQILGL